jgi:hypothetical protein
MAPSACQPPHVPFRRSTRACDIRPSRWSEGVPLPSDDPRFIADGLRDLGASSRRTTDVHGGGMNVWVIVRLGVDGTSPKRTFELSAVTMPSHSSPGGQPFHA